MLDLTKEKGHSNSLSISDVLHPNRANVSKDELRSKLSELYKSTKDQVSVFGFRTQYGGGKSTGFALIYDSNEAMKKFEPHYRLVRYGQATKIEKASRQQRTFIRHILGAKKECGLIILPIQANNARTEQRRYGVRPRPRVYRRTRRRSRGFMSLLSLLWRKHMVCIHVSSYDRYGALRDLVDITNKMSSTLTSLHSCKARYLLL